MEYSSIHIIASSKIFVRDIGLDWAVRMDAISTSWWQTLLLLDFARSFHFLHLLVLHRHHFCGISDWDILVFQSLKKLYLGYVYVITNVNRVKWENIIAQPIMRALAYHLSAHLILCTVMSRILCNMPRLPEDDITLFLWMTILESAGPTSSKATKEVLTCV